MNTEQIRNFCIIAHIDHGKSTLADRFLELTGTIEGRHMHDQLLDSMELEQERGITIKLAPVQMHYTQDAKPYILNLIDTPGHVDFSYEVSRALAAVEGAILLIDGTKGVQAQTLSHLYEAQRQNLVIIPAINKIDLPNARVDEIEEEIYSLLSDTKKIFKISAKEGKGVEELLLEVLRAVPSPLPSKTNYPRALIFDSQYDPYKGVLAYVRVFDGSFNKESAIKFLAADKKAQALELGVFKPDLLPSEDLKEGMIGYIATGLKDPGVVRVGDTIVVEAPNSKFESRNSKLEPLAGYREPRPVVFASVFPSEGADLAVLQDAFAKLKLTDWALTFETESSEVLGRGFRCGFLGSLHLEITLERLQREFDLSFVATTPSVSYELKLTNGKEQIVTSPSEFPSSGDIKEVKEPWVRINIFVPEKYLGSVMQLLQNRRGIYKNTNYITPERIELVYEIPLTEIIIDFYDKLKSISSGFASLNYQVLESRPGDLVRLDVLVAEEKVEAFSRIVPKGNAYNEGRALVGRLKELLPRELFAVSLQAALGGKIIARETLPALKKDVTGYLYGGDITRKRKLWEKQKRGKKKLKKIGRVFIPDRVFVEMLRTKSSD